MARLTALATLFCLVLATGGAAADAAADAADIAATRARNNAAIARHDADGIVRSYDTPYQLNTGAGLLFHDDPEAEAAMWAEHFAALPDVLYVRTPGSIEVSSFLDRAYESGTWVGTMTLPGGPVETGGRYSASWRKIDGAWKIQSELFVTLYCKGDGCQD